VTGKPLALGDPTWGFAASCITVIFTSPVKITVIQDARSHAAVGATLTMLLATA